MRQNKSVIASGSSTLKKSIPKQTSDPVCRHKPRVCCQPVLEKYDYCLNHILEDKNAPYKPCAYSYPNNNKRCLIPAPQGEKNDIV